MKKIFTLLLVFVLSFSVAFAAEKDVVGKKKESMWEKLRNKIESVTPKKKFTAVTAVGGVRGAKNESDDLYWKDEDKGGKVSMKEMADFSAVVQKASESTLEGAAKLFSGYIEANPNGYFIKDAKEALASLNQTMNPSSGKE